MVLAKYVRHARIVALMAKATITLEIALSDEDRGALRDAIACSTDDLRTRLPAFAHAAFAEYKEMMLGEAPITTATEVREQRLLRIIELALDASIPDVGRVARLFSIPASSARVLLRAVTSKHRRRFECRAQNSDYDTCGGGDIC